MHGIVLGCKDSLNNKKGLVAGLYLVKQILVNRSCRHLSELRTYAFLYLSCGQGMWLFEAGLD